MWVEKYEQGELVDDQLGYLTSPVDETGLIIFATKIDGVDEQQTFHIGVGDEDGVSSLTTRDTPLTPPYSLRGLHKTSLK